MPLGYERLNARHQSPNERIVFIKPLEGSDKATSQDFLERIAAICTPIMKANYLSVVSLEEYEPNREFWGRNFNAGEVIQLVLKSPSNGRWLPFTFVQMVMMHELAHCKQMNHSRAFWKVRNQYTAELKLLWAKNYTGDGFWGKGQMLYDGQYTSDSMPANEQMPQHLCGGVYRSGKGKRKRKVGAEKLNLSYAGRKQRRIEKKFGTNGLTLGEDEDTRLRLENGKRVVSKPRVAGSKRGRELRAAAALARFGQSNDVGATVKDQDELSDTEDEYDDDEEWVKKEAIDGKGNKILDSKGHVMVKVCEDEDTTDDPDARHELQELGQIGTDRSGLSAKSPLPKSSTSPAIKIEGEDVAIANSIVNEATPAIKIEHEDSSTASESEGDSLEMSRKKTAFPVHSISKQLQMPSKDEPQSTIPKFTPTHVSEHKSRLKHEHASRDTLEQVFVPAESSGNRDLTGATQEIEAPLPIQVLVGQTCVVCSLENAPDALTCAACAHVLHPDKLSHHWRCQMVACQGSQYMNSADVGRCGICGAVKGMS